MLLRLGLPLTQALTPHLFLLGQYQISRKFHLRHALLYLAKLLWFVIWRKRQWSMHNVLYSYCIWIPTWVSEKRKHFIILYSNRCLSHLFFYCSLWAVKLLHFWPNMFYNYNKNNHKNNIEYYISFVDLQIATCYV